MPMGLEPFDPKKHKPKDVGKGGPSTELTISEYAPDGSIWNVPTLWWDDEGNPLELRPDQAMQMAHQYERQTGKKFPRFRSIDEAVRAAEGRSKAGGATRSYLAAP